MSDAAVLCAPRRREVRALKSLLRIAYALTRECGDVYVGRHERMQVLVLEAWAREVDVAAAEDAIPPRLRAEAHEAAGEIDGSFEVISDPAGRKVIFRILARESS